MNIKLNGGGSSALFSQFMWRLPNVAGIEVDKIYLSASEGVGFDYIFDQYYDDSFIDIACSYYGTYASDDRVKLPDGRIALGSIENHPTFNSLKKACSKINIKKNIIEIVDKFSAQFTPNTLGVHVRTADMNIIHPEYGVFTTNDYINRIKDIKDTETIDTIFVASDNNGSIDMIRNVFGNVLSYDCVLREATENFKDDSMHSMNMHNPILWEEAFIEMLLLSRCSQLLCRVSNLANASILFSNSLTKIHRL
jgi:hypothetical protein